MCSKRCWSLLFKAVIVLLAIVLDPTDVYTDFALGIQYLRDGDTNWGAATLVLMLVPYVLQLILFAGIAVFDSHTNHGSKVRKFFFMFMAAIGPLGHWPLAQWLQASPPSSTFTRKIKSMPQVAKPVFRSGESSIIIIIENLPQLILQMYVVGRRNHADTVVLAALITSFFSASKRLLNFGMDVGVDGLEIDLPLVKEMV
jgi:hypothetical protein